MSAEIDLIPADYREQMRFRKYLLRFFSVVGCGLAVLLAVKLWLSVELYMQKENYTRLTAQETVLAEESKLLDKLKNEVGQLKVHLAVLNSLRSGPDSGQLFALIDQAVNPSVWLSSWSFSREENRAEEGAAPAGTPGYFIIVPEKQQVDPARDKSSWQNVVKMEIKGRALTHLALSRFVEALLAQAEVKKVKVLQTNKRRYTFGEIVEYSLAIEIYRQGIAP